MFNIMGIMEIDDRAKNSLFSSRIIPWLIIGVGAVLRIAQFIYNRSLTEGEAALALNIVQRSYSQLLRPLDYAQAAPVGFLLLQKFMSTLFGLSELGLRFLPLITGIGALFLFYKVAKKTISEQSLTIALVLFAVGDHLIYFASEVKQYSSDVFIALLIIWLAILVFDKKFEIKYTMLFGFVSALCLWFSHPALFVFCASLIVIYIYALRRPQWSTLPSLLIATMLGLASFLANYLVTLSSLCKHEQLLTAWQSSFMPLPPTSLSDIKWFAYVFLRTFKFPVGLSIYELLLAVLAFLWGCIMMFRYKKKIVLLLILPILLALIASGLHRYPFEGRLLLFLTPFMILVIAQGISDIRNKIRHQSNFLGIALVVILLIHPVLLAGYHLIKPRAPEELRTVLEYVDENLHDGDVIYVYYASLNAFRYYHDRYGFPIEYVEGIESRSEWTNYYQDLQRLRGNKRVWLVFSHVATHCGVDEERLFVSYLDLLGTQLDAFKAPGSAGYLYNMTLFSIY